MSVTFGARIMESDATEWSIKCWSDEAMDFVPHPAAPSLAGMTYQQAWMTAEAWYRTEGLDEQMRDEKGIHVTYEVPAVRGLPLVNMANGNAREVLMALELDAEDLWGCEAADAFLARVLISLAVDRLDDARPEWIQKGERGPTVIHTARPAGYVNHQLERLLELAKACRAAGREVCWS